jgi:GNAT superfamily N-acetyltransferase
VSLRPCTAADLPEIFAIINDAAQAYRGIIPADRWHDPYMPMAELQEALADGVRFWGCEDDGRLVGVMGLQDRGEVELVRHAYVRTALRQKGVGARLLRHLESVTAKPILIGTWAAASWAIRFYQKHGYRLLPHAEAAPLMRRYWGIPDRQVDTSVVLAGPRWQP